MTDHPDQPSSEATDGIDRLSAVLERFRVRVRLLHAGALCGLTRFDDPPGRGYLHVLRRGTVTVSHALGSGAPTRLTVEEPSVLFYARPVAHPFHNPPVEGPDFTCATLEFDGGAAHPLVQALPPLLVLPLAQVAGIAPALDLLWGEVDRVQCGQRVLADRLFEVVLIHLLRWLVDHPEAAALPPGLLTGLHDPGIARALVAIHEAPGAPWRLAELARLAGVSRSVFAARFRALVGQPPGDYVAAWRLTVAQARVRAGEPIKAIAAELGYANASTLSRLFSRRVGASPRAWRTRAPE